MEKYLTAFSDELCRKLAEEGDYELVALVRKTQKETPLGKYQDEMAKWQETKTL